MNEFLYNFLGMGWSAFAANITACVIFTVIAMGLLRKVTGGKFRSEWRHIAWIILPVSFMIPFRFKMPFTKIPLITASMITLSVHSAPMTFEEGITDVARFGTTGDGAYAVSAGNYAAAILLIGTFVTLGYQLAKLIALDKRVKRRGIVCKNAEYLSALEKICGELKIKTPQIVIFPEADTPFAMGIRHPKIILPSQEFSAEEIGFIFRHEAVHIKRGDILLKLLMIIFRSLNWYNPFAYILCRQAFEDMEISCDERAAAGFTPGQRESYSRTILRGISKGRYPAVTTYLSSNAKTLKKRITSVMTLKKLSGAVPFALALCAVFLLAHTVYALPDGDESGAFYLYNSPYPIEEDPYVTTTDWRTCEADSAQEAAEKIFRQYMDMYTGADVPDYCRVEDYYITDSSGNRAVERTPLLSRINYKLFNSGLLDKSEFCGVTYNARFANECGNTVHNQNFGFNNYLNGTVWGAHIVMDLEKNGRTYSLVNMGIGDGTAMTGQFHFENDLTETMETLERMGKCGLLDYSWDIYGNLPKAEDVNAYEYITFKILNPDKDPWVTSTTFLGGCIPMEYLSEADNADKEARVITLDGYEFSDASPEYCGYDADFEKGEVSVYLNALGSDPHGVTLRLEYTDKTFSGRMSYFPVLVSLTVSDELFDPVIYHDSFDSIPLPESLAGNRTVAGAEKIMEYMKTPRDGCDFTVLDYRNISVENGGVYAEVKFKGRLEGKYSSDLKKTDKKTKQPVSDGYIRVQIV